ncbi:hypothetical protein V9T40_003016 [Parthenolecanium corni]|uniref:Uncharacterized protein n=1 Tax=Parthenolecanium corni TaxID=536013 RepID=A0AAN9Y9S4_9HEMI
MEKSYNDDEYVAKTSTNNNTPSADVHPAADTEASQLEFDTNFSQHEAEEPFTQPFGPGNLAGMPETTIVMTPTDFTQVIEEESKTWRLSHRGTSMGAFRSSQERIQIASGIDSETVHGTVGEAKDVEGKIDQKSVADGNASPASDDQDAEVVTKIARPKNIFLKDDILKESLEPYKIDILLRKKVNRSTKKKLWREIEKRKPFITENVREHIRNYAKPPFITWACRNCVFPYESRA